MSIVASRSIQITLSGDITGNIIKAAADNLTSSAEPLYVSLASGNNLISPPSVSGITVTALTIIPPPTNTNLLTVKGTNADTGFPIHKTDPTSIGVDTTFSAIVINAAATTAPVQLVWS